MRDLLAFPEPAPASPPDEARPALDAAGLSRLFLEPRTHTHWLPEEVPGELLEEAWTLARPAPTSANCSPMRLVLLRTPEEKALLLPALAESNRRKSLTAPVVAIIAFDREFWRLLPRLYPHVDAAAWFRDDPAGARETALRNGTLQAAWYMLALRALGLDLGPLSGLDAAKVDEIFFAGTAVETNFVLNIGYGDASRLKPRGARLEFAEVLVAPPGTRDLAPALRLT
jgi:3-hydroxypropanoate dehydrogenase